jgi:hypothetical protein
VIIEQGPLELIEWALLFGANPARRRNPLAARAANITRSVMPTVAPPIRTSLRRNLKSQTPIPKQIANTKSQINAGRVAAIGIWSLAFVWYLVLGDWGFLKGAQETDEQKV